MDGYLQIKQKMILAMLGQGIKSLILLFLTSCLSNNNKIIDNNKNYDIISKNLVGKDKYFEIYKKINDSLSCWRQNKIGYYGFCSDSKNCFIDSLLCINENRDRLITAKLMQQFNNPRSDGIDFMYGEKIENNWYFFSGASIVIPREYYSKDVSTPLSYSELHVVALKEVFGGYLKPDGSINEAWFTEHFEGPGWSDPDYTGAKTKQDSLKIKDWHYKVCHARQNLRVWNGLRTVCSLYSVKDIKLEYVSGSEELKILLPVKSYEAKFMFNDTYSYAYSINDNFIKNVDNIKLNKEATELNFSIKKIPTTCTLSIMIGLSEVGPLNFEINIDKGKIVKIVLKECVDKTHT